MNLCETCKWWGDDEDRAAPASTTRLRSCNHPKVLPRLSRESRCDAYGIKDSEVPDDGFLCEDDEGWSRLMGPKFGCVNHEDVSATAKLNA